MLPTPNEKDGVEGNGGSLKGGAEALMLFHIFDLTAGLYGCQVWATFSLTYDSSVTTRAHALHLGFLKKLLGVKKSTDTHCVLRETTYTHLYSIISRH